MLAALAWPNLGLRPQGSYNAVLCLIWNENEWYLLLLLLNQFKVVDTVTIKIEPTIITRAVNIATTYWYVWPTAIGPKGPVSK